MAATKQNGEAPARIRVEQHADGSVTITLPPPPATTRVVQDELVPVKSAGVEVKAVYALRRRGLLDVVLIGRRHYVKRSALLAAFDALAAEQKAATPPPKKATEMDDYERAVAQAREPRRRGKS